MELIICTSPLQVLIAERIIQINPDKSFFGVMVTHTPNEKFVYYYNRLRSSCQHGFMLAVSYGTHRLQVYWDSLWLIAKGYTLPHIATVYVSSTDITEVQFFLQRFSGATIKTFDDGLINLNPVAFEHMMVTHTSYWHKILKGIFRFSSTRELLTRSIEHYTIYKQSNVMPNAKYIGLLDTLHGINPQEKARETKNILLGQALYWDDETYKNIDLANRVISQFRIDRYLPHPKETYHVTDVEYINTNLICEDYIIKYLNEYPEQDLCIYTYCSTPAINLHGIPRLKFIALRPKDVPNFLSKVYEIFNQVGIEIINL